MQIQGFDWLFIVVLTVAMPLVGFNEHRRLQARVARRDPNARTRTYWHAILLQWPLSIILLAAWLGSGRNVADLGIRFETSSWTWLGWSLTVLIIAALVGQTLQALRRAENMAAVRREIEPVRAVVPSNEREARLFNVVSVTAGICEEFLYRGYLIAVFAALTNIWLGVALASLAFGLGHVYQGAKGIVKTTIIGLVMAGLYQLTGSLWTAMLLHAAIDVNSGYLGRRALSSHAPAPGVQAAA